jgi:L-fucose mutarotase
MSSVPARRLQRVAGQIAGDREPPASSVVATPTLLKGISPILTADLLHVLRSAGHGDEIALVDCNFPAAECATKTVSGKCITLAGVDQGC